MESKLFSVIEEKCSSIQALQKILLDVENVNLRNNFGENALEVLILNWSKSISPPSGASPNDIMSNIVKAVQLLIDAGTDVNCKNRDGRGVIQVLMSIYNKLNEKYKILEMLIKAGADVNSKDEYGQMMLHVAVYDNYNPVDFIRFLLQFGVDVNSQDNFGCTALHKAVQKNNKEVVECLINAGADVNLKNREGRTVLHLAAKEKYNYNQIDFIRFLLQIGVEVDSQDKEGYTALHFAAEKHNKEVVECLINAGANCSRATLEGYTSLYLAVYGASYNFKTKWANRSETIDRYGVQKQNKEIVDYLIDAGVDINRKTMSGKTALHGAALVPNVDLIKYLVIRGADVNAKSKSGDTPLHMLMCTDIRFGDDSELLAEALESLLSANADVNAIGSHGNTPLHNFIICNNLFINRSRFERIISKATESFLIILKIFIKYGANFRIRNGESKRPMDTLLPNYHCYENFNHIIVLLETLIKYGLMDIDNLFTADIFNGMTILHWSCLSLRYDIVKFTVNYGADINVLDGNLNTPLLNLIRGLSESSEDSIMSEKLEILDYILGLNPDINKRTDTGLHILNISGNRFNYPDFLWKALIEHIAKKQSTGFMLHPSIVQTISENFEYQTYLDKCTDELRRLQKLKFSSSGVNLRDILMDHNKKLVCYAKNKVLVQEFNDILLSLNYPIYGLSISKRFLKAVQKQKVLEKSAEILSLCLPYHFDPTHLVIKKIICNVELKYLRYLCEPESEELKVVLERDEFKISLDKYVCSCLKI